ncbi:hypothetical protein ACFC0S_00675 [Streptomyces sp. NPDC056084]|uniref:hypothetical protein n=1 Tax=unclassified Streptomyces TaxID=2593676 RepID=UPI0035D98076
MPPFWNLRRFRAFRAMQRRFEPYDAVDAYVQEMSAADAPPVVAQLDISAFGFRARAQGKSGFAALRALREHYPVLVHALYTYLAVMGLLFALALASFAHR